MANTEQSLGVGTIIMLCKSYPTKAQTILQLGTQLKDLQLWGNTKAQWDDGPCASVLSDWSAAASLANIISFCNCLLTSMIPGGSGW